MTDYFVLVVPNQQHQKHLIRRLRSHYSNSDQPDLIKTDSSGITNIIIINTENF